MITLEWTGIWSTLWFTFWAFLGLKLSGAWGSVSWWLVFTPLYAAAAWGLLAVVTVAVVAAVTAKAVKQKQQDAALRAMREFPRAFGPW